MISEGNFLHPLCTLDHSWETRENWLYPAIYVIQTSSFSEPEVQVLRNALSNEEVSKSKRFRIPMQRDSYIITHALFRLKLGLYLDEKPEQIRVENGFLGKPYLPEYPDVHFNLSHCNGISLIAFDTRNEIGVDVEDIRPGYEWEPVAERFFSDPEKLLIRSSGDNDQFIFNKLWTRKEALIKAHGSGINEMNLHVDVRLDNSDENFFLKTLFYLKTYVITAAVAHNSEKADIYLPGNNLFTFNV